MENRFSTKDFVLYLLIAGLLISTWLAMVQFDRQWDEMRAIRVKVEDQAKDLRGIHESLRRGAAVPRPTTTDSVATTAPSDPNDPFSRVRAARAMPGFAEGDWLIDAFAGGVAKLTPLLSGDSYAATVQAYVLESLIARNPETLEWMPLVAAEPGIVQDNSAEWDQYIQARRDAGAVSHQVAHDPARPVPLKITFKLRENVRFSDGTPLTADDVVFTFNFIMDDRIAAPRQRAYYQMIEKVVKDGPHQVTFVFREPYFEAYELAGSMDILAKHFYGRYLDKPEEFNQSVGLLFGSGPYRLEDPVGWKPGKLIQLVRNERYWGVAPAIERLVFKEIKNDVARLTEFRNGDIDIFAASPEQYREMIADKAILNRAHHFEYQSPIGGYSYVAWNQMRNGKPTWFADKRVRQAMTLLTDRKRMIREVMLGYGVEATGPYNPQSKQCSPKVQPWPYDVARAQALLAEAGFRDRDGDRVLESADGAPFEVKLTYPSGSINWEKRALFLKDAYAKAGIVLKLDPLEWSVFTQRLENKDFDAITLGWTAGIETDIYQMFHSSQMLAGGDNFMSYRNEELDRLIDQARRTVREDLRMPLWQRTHEILHEDQPYTFLTFAKSLVFIDNRLQNIQLVKLGLNPRIEWFVPADRMRWTR